MATVAQGQSKLVNLGPNDAIKVSTPGEAYVDHLSGTPESPYASARLIKNTEPKVFGPYGVNAQLRVRAIESSALYDGYTDPQPALVNTDPTTGQTVIVGPDGSNYALIRALDFNGRTLLSDIPAYQGKATINDPSIGSSIAAIYATTYTSFVETPDSSIPTNTFTAVSGNSYFVDPISGLDSNPGTKAQPFKTIQRLKSISAANLAGATINLAYEIFETKVSWASFAAGTDFAYMDFNNFKGTSAAPLIVRPYHARTQPGAKKPTLRYFAEIASTDWVNEGNNVWSISYNVSGSEGFDSSKYFMFGDSKRLGVNVYHAAGATVADKVNSWGKFWISEFGTAPEKKMYLYSEGNPNSYYKRVFVGGRPMFRSYYSGLSHTSFIGIRFEYVYAAELTCAGSDVNAAVRGLRMVGCTFYKGGALSLFNLSNHTLPTEAEYKISDCEFYEVPVYGIRNHPVLSGNVGNTVNWEIYRNKVYGSNYSYSTQGWFYNQAKGSGTYRAWGNYGFDCRNGIGGASNDGAFIYSELSSENSEVFGNVAEQCGIPYQINCAKNSKLISNVAIDCTKLVLFTAANDPGFKTDVDVVIAHNTWVFTGRVDPPMTGSIVPVGTAPIAGWNASTAYKWDAVVILNNALLDLSGIWANKPGIWYKSDDVKPSTGVLLIAGNALSGFGSTAVLDANGNVNVTNNPQVVSVLGQGNSWFIDADSGVVALSKDSPLNRAGYGKLENPYFDIGGNSFTSIPDVGAVARIS